MRQVHFATLVVSATIFSLSLQSKAQTSAWSLSEQQRVISEWNSYYQSKPIGGEYIDDFNVASLPNHLRTSNYKFTHVCADSTWNWDYSNGLPNQLVRGVGGFMVGLHVNSDNFTCSKNAVSYVVFDTSTHRSGMHACPSGSAMVGFHERLNILACSSPTNGRNLIAWQEQRGYFGDRNGMHSCPVGWVMTGVHVNSNEFLCTPTTGPGVSADPPPGGGGSGGSGGGSGTHLQ